MNETEFEEKLAQPLTGLLISTNRHVTIEQYAHELGVQTSSLQQGQICGYVFKSGEPTYSCT